MLKKVCGKNRISTVIAAVSLLFILFGMSACEQEQPNHDLEVGRLKAENSFLKYTADSLQEVLDTLKLKVEREKNKKEPEDGDF